MSTVLGLLPKPPGANIKEFLLTILSASIRKYNDVFSGARSERMLTPFGPGSWPRAALSPEAFDVAQSRAKYVRNRTYEPKDLVKRNGRKSNV